ncbi:MAG: V-type ATP synthase subunit E [Candidatus Micrarchaeota archaeon]
MGLENLCREIEQNAKARAAELLSDARKQAKKIVKEAEDGAESKIIAAKKDATQFSKAETSERITSAQLEAQKIISDAKEEAVRKNVQLVWEEFSQARKRPGYAKKLRRWAELAIEELSSPGAVLRCASEDKTILTSAGFKVGKPIECAGGVRAETKDNKIIVDYTLEAQFEQKKEKIVKIVHSKLFTGTDEFIMPVSKPSRSAKKRKRRKGKKKRRGKRGK